MQGLVMVVKKYAVLKNTTVENVILIDENLVPTWFENDPERELVLAEDAEEAEVGSIYENGTFAYVQNYRELRKEAYGDIGDQLDMQYHDSVNGTTAWVDHIAAVKAKYPKP